MVLDERQAEGVRALNRFFDRIYFITIERNAERRELAKTGLFGLNITVFEGVDGRALSTEQLEQVDSERTRRRLAREMSLGEIGCALAHRNVYADVLANGFERVLVIEDDIHFDFTKLRFVPTILNAVPARWDMIYFLTYRTHETLLWRAKIHLVYPLFNALRVRDYPYPVERYRAESSRLYSRHFLQAGQHWGAWAYALTKNSARDLLDACTPVVVPSDFALRDYCLRKDRRSFVSAKNVFVRTGQPSSIDNVADIPRELESDVLRVQKG